MDMYAHLLTFFEVSNIGFERLTKKSTILFHVNLLISAMKIKFFACIGQ